MSMFPDFNPINPWGRKAKLPDGWKSPIREPLFRVVVDMRGHDLPVAVGPATHWALCNEFHHAITQQIAKGAERNWSNPTIIPA